jgi:AraC family transcriptional regulator of adaptative response / DNA-3-methyladenine glycosylase II
MILKGGLNSGGIEKLAARSGLGSRQLRRLFVQHLGAAPLRIANAHRTQRALKLISDSTLPMSQIAFRSGFQSIREFNHAIRSSTGHSPTKLRAGQSASGSRSDRSALELRLAYTPPYDWESLIAFWGQRAIPGVEFVNGDSYQRTIEIGGVAGRIMVHSDNSRSCLVVNLELDTFELLGEIAERIRSMFDLRANPEQIADQLSRDVTLRGLIKMRPGLRIPGSWNGFESAVLSLLGDRLTTVAHKRPVAALVRMFGTLVENPIRGLEYLFPRPEVLAFADLSTIGISDACACAIRKLSMAAVQGNVGFANSGTIDEALIQIKSVCGMNESMAQYIAMRAFSYPDAFPYPEASFARRLAASGQQLSSTGVLEIAGHWRPWRAYAAMYLTMSTAQ